MCLSFAKQNLDAYFMITVLFFIESCHSPLSSARGPLLYENVNRSQGLYVFILMDKRLYISLSLSKWLIIIGSWKKDTSLGFAQTRCRFFVSLFLHPNVLFELTNKKAEKTVFNWNQSTETILASWNVDDSFSLAVHNFSQTFLPTLFTGILTHKDSTTQKLTCT